jgi:hypothetical protein
MRLHKTSNYFVGGFYGYLYTICKTSLTELVVILFSMKFAYGVPRLGKSVYSNWIYILSILIQKNIC